MRLIDADELFKEDRAEFEKNPIFTNYDVYMSEVLREIDNAPTVDAVPVIRCKDCTHFMPIEQKGWGQCEICLNLYYSHRLVGSKDYCSSAEPKQR